MKAFEHLYKQENVDIYNRREELKEKVLKERGSDVMFRVKKLSENQISKDQTEQLYDDRVAKMK